MKRFIKWFDSGAFQLTRVLLWLGMVTMVVMMFLTVSDVIGRYLFNSPIKGTYELMELMEVFVALGAVAYGQRMAAHVSVDFLVRHLRRKVQLGLAVFSDILSLGLFGIAAWQLYFYTLQLWRSNKTSMMLEVPYGPFVLVACISMVAMVLETLLTLIKDATALAGGSE